MVEAPLLRTRVRHAMVWLAAAAVVLFGVPLAVAVQRVLSSEALAGLQRDATRAVAAVPDNTLESRTGLTAPEVGTTLVALYDVAGARLAGLGPGRSVLAGRARDGKEHHGQEDGQLVVVLPVLSDTAVAGSVRAARPMADLRHDVLQAWGGLAALAGCVMAVTFVVARRASRRIAEPFEELTAASTSLRSGVFDVSLPRWGLQEADAAGAALEQTAREMGQLITQERDFVRHASHQLRTPLAGLLVQLEQLARDGSPTADAALERARQLESTLDDLLLVRSPVVPAACDAAEVARELVARWAASTPRSVSLRAVDVEQVAVPAAAVRQALEVLVDNAIRHGRGSVTITVEPLGVSVVLEVADEGSGFQEHVRFGTGLRLATGLVQRFGGELILRRRSPKPRVALLLPQASSSSNR